ncbi:MAG: hypothetical protein C4547_09040, partial [Phycisphaerales bacterium]
MTDYPRRVLIISNPTSGRRRRADWCERVALALREAGVEVDLYETAQSGDACRYAAEVLFGAEASTQARAVPGPGSHRLEAGDTPGLSGSGVRPPPFDCIIACGGDGTIQEVASALADHRAFCAGSVAAAATPALGIIASGRCNDLAHALGVHGDVESTIDALLAGRRMALDLGRVNGRCFCTVATM